MKWVSYPFDHAGGRMMALGHGAYVYVVGTWHARDSWQGCVYKERWLKDSRIFHGPTGQDDARRWCEVENKRHAPRKRAIGSASQGER